MIAAFNPGSRRAAKGRVHAAPQALRAGQAAILLCAVLWSTSGLFIKLINWDPLVIAGMRSIVAGIFMLVVRFLSPSRRTLPFRPGTIWRGAFAYSLTMILFVIANKLTTSANAILLQYSAPVWAALLGWLLAREKPRAANWISLVMMSGGLCLFFKDGLEGGSFTGNLLALASGICFAANSVFLRVQKDGDTADSMLLSHFITALTSVPFVIRHPPLFTAGSVSAVLFMGIFQLGAASLLFAHGIKRVPAMQAMLTAAVEPILSPVWVLIVTGEKPDAAAAAGGAVIIGAVLVSSIRRNR